MNEEKFNVSIRKFLKELGVTSQREIEKAVRAAIESGALKGTESLPIKAVVTIGAVKLDHTVEGTIELN
jgi:hypothetical protein